MLATSSKRGGGETGHSSKAVLTSLKNKRKTISCCSDEEVLNHNGQKRRKMCSYSNSVYKSIFLKDTFHKSEPKEALMIKEKLISGHVKPKRPDNDFRDVAPKEPHSDFETCWMDVLPHEILLKIFSYLPLGMLLHTIPQVCKKWETLALDWTLWRAVEDLTIKNMVISTTKLRTLLRTIPKLKKLELILRNDTEELLHELFETHQNLEVLKLDRCYRSTLQINILSQTVTSILELCPKLKAIMLTDTYFHSKNFYRCLAKKFRTIERINVTCTTKSEMDVFMRNLKENVPEVNFQRVPMMGRAEGKQIYWGPILGLVVRPIPTSPFHQQYVHDNYPNYAF